MNAIKSISSTIDPIPQHGRIAPEASSFVGKIAIALVCLSCVFFMCSVQDIFNLPKMWLASLGVLVGLWGSRA